VLSTFNGFVIGGEVNGTLYIMFHDGIVTSSHDVLQTLICFGVLVSGGIPLQKEKP